MGPGGQRVGSAWRAGLVSPSGSRLAEPARSLAQDPGSKIPELDPEFRIVTPASWVKDPEYRIRDLGSEMFATLSEFPSLKCWIQNPGSRFRILDPGSRILDPGFSIWDPESLLQGQTIPAWVVSHDG